MPQLINLENQEFMASENVGHTLALKDEHIKKITDAYEQFMQSVKPIEQMPQTEELVNPQVNVETQQVLDPNINIMDQSNAPATSGAETPSTFGQEQVFPEQSSSFNEMNNMEIGTLNEASNIGSQAPLETNAFEQPTILEQPMAQPIEQPVVTNPEPVQSVEVNKEVSLDSSVSEIDEIKNNMISLMDRLKAKEEELKKREDIVKEKEATVDAKLTVANQAWENAQAVNNTMGNQANVQTQTDVQNRTLVA